MDMVNGRNKYLVGSGEWTVNGINMITDCDTTSRQTLNVTVERLDVTLTREQFEDGVVYSVATILTIHYIS